jgi:hypothetical protein
MCFAQGQNCDKVRGSYLNATFIKSGICSEGWASHLWRNNTTFRTAVLAEMVQFHALFH